MALMHSDTRGLNYTIRDLRCCEAISYLDTSDQLIRWIQERMSSENIRCLPFNFRSPGYWELKINNQRYFSHLALIKGPTCINRTFYILVLIISTSPNFEYYRDTPSPHQYQFNIKVFELNEDSNKRQVFEENHMVANLVCYETRNNFPNQMFDLLSKHNQKVIKSLFDVNINKYINTIEYNINNIIINNQKNNNIIINYLKNNNIIKPKLFDNENKLLDIDKDELRKLTEIFKACQSSEQPVEVCQLAEVTQPAPQLDICSICLDDLDNENEITTLKPCDHKLHIGCCNRLFETCMTSQVKCPLCRANITN